MGFNMYSEIILIYLNFLYVYNVNIINFFGYFQVEIHTNYSCTHILGSSGTYASSPEKILKMWCSLVRFEVNFDQIVY